MGPLHSGMPCVRKRRRATPLVQARIAMIYKAGCPEAACSYRPINIATGMYSILARLILDTLRGPIDAALFDPQAGCRQGYTTSQQALRMLMLLHQYGDGALVCLLDIAKALPSMPHECLTYGLQLIGTPARIYNMVASIYVHSTGVYGDVRFPLRRGIKEGCPLSPALFVLVYEAFHQTLTREFPTAPYWPMPATSPSSPRTNGRCSTSWSASVSCLPYWASRRTPQRHRCTIGPHPPAVRVWHEESPRPETPSRGAMRDCRCSPLSSTTLVTSWHIWEQKARDDFVGTAAVDLARYQYLPLNAFERVQLLNTILIPRWTYRTLFLPNDSMFNTMVLGTLAGPPQHFAPSQQPPF